MLLSVETIKALMKKEKNRNLNYASIARVTGLAPKTVRQFADKPSPKIEHETVVILSKYLIDEFDYCKKHIIEMNN